MKLFVFTVIGMVIFMIGFGAFDLGGTLSVLLFLLVLLIGATVRAWQGIIDWARGPAAKL
jgi:hypothetical protein